MAASAIEAGQSQPHLQVNMSQNNTPSMNASPKRLEGIDVKSQSTQNSPEQEVQSQPQSNYSQPVQTLPIVNGAVQSNGQQQQQQQPIQQIQITQPVQQNPIPAHHAQMQVLQQAPQQQTLFHQQNPTQQQTSQQQQMSQQQQNIINQQFLGQQTFALQQQPIMFQHQVIPTPQQQGIQQQLYQSQPQQHLAMVQTPILYSTQPAAVVSNPTPGAVAAPTSANNTPVSKAIKKGRFRVVKPGKQEPPNETDVSVVSSTSENPSETATAVTTKKKGRFIVRTKSVPDASVLSPTKETVAGADKSDADDAAASKGGGLPPQPPPSSDKVVAGVSNVKKKGRFRIKSGINLADVDSSVASEKVVSSHDRRPSDDTKLSSMGDFAAEDNAPSIVSSTQVPPGSASNAQIPTMDVGSSNALPQYTTFVPSMTSYDVNNQVMMVSAPFLTAQNTSMPMMQTSVQQSQMQQMYQNQVQVQQQQLQQQQQQVPAVAIAQQIDHDTVPTSHPLGLPLSNPNSPTPRTEPSQTQPHVPQLPQQQPLPQRARSDSPIPKRPTASSSQTMTTSGSGGWRGISGSQGKNGRLIGSGGVGKILHNLDCLRQEVLDADKSMTSLQSDNRFLRTKNKELEAKISNLEKRLAEEKSLRRSADAKVQALRQKVKELEPTKIDSQVGEETSAPPSDGKQAPKSVEDKSTSAAPDVIKSQEIDNSEGGLDTKLQASPPKKSSSLNEVEGEPKPKSPQPIRRALGSMSDLDIASLSKPQEAAVKQFDPLTAIAPPPPLCHPTSSVVMAQNFQSLVDDNIAPIPMIVTTQMSTSDGETTIETKGNENVQHFDPLGTPEKSQSQLNIQTLVLNPVVPSVPTLTHVNGSPAIATTTVPVYTLPIPTIQLPPQQQQMQPQPKQQEHDPFDDIVCRGQIVEQNGNIDSVR